jgi:predicted kinase
MPKLILMVGPPGSGKSTLAKSLIYDDGDHGLGTVYVNQDSQQKEGHLIRFNQALGLGKNIIIDRMGFSKAQRDRYLDPAKVKGYETEIVVLHQPYRVCLERCLARTGHETIKDETSARAALATFFGKYERVQDSEADKVTRIWPEGHKPLAVISDLDGTLCNVDHRLHFVRKPKGDKKDWKSFFDNIIYDGLNKWCADILNAMSKEHIIVYCSGRPDDRRSDTVAWLQENDLFDFENGGPNYDFHLYMRPRNDSRDDSIVKEIILDFEILTRFTPYFFIDDRKRVFEMWRRRGFTCLACANGDF